MRKKVSTKSHSVVFFSDLRQHRRIGLKDFVMSAEAIDTDYLVVGAGAAAMAFVDTLLTESDARVVMVDRRHRPGGHWNDAYPFVGLHQPAAFYGVASKELGDWRKDDFGPNAGFYSLSTGAEVQNYFDQVMRQRFLPSGRVAFHAMAEYSQANGSHRITSLTSGETREVRPRKLVDATHARTEVPSTHPPKYEFASDLALIPVNQLTGVRRPYSRYAVVGSGKTGMDACLWLLQNGVPPERVRWIMPRDGWLLNRANFQPGFENFEASIGALVSQLQIISESSSLSDLFHTLEKAQLLLRINPEIEPTCYRCAVVSLEELRELRRIADVVRLGRLRAIYPTRLVAERGEMQAHPDTLYIDCSASAIQVPPTTPVFSDDTINLLMVRTCQPLFSAAVIAWVEAHVTELEEKNSLCNPVPSPEKPRDWLRMWGASLRNAGRWRGRPDLEVWMRDCRLNTVNAFLRGVRPEDTEKLAMLKRVGEAGAAAAARIPHLLAAQEMQS